MAPRIKLQHETHPPLPNGPAPALVYPRGMACPSQASATHVPAAFFFCGIRPSQCPCVPDACTVYPTKLLMTPKHKVHPPPPGTLTPNTSAPYTTRHVPRASGGQSGAHVPQTPPSPCPRAQADQHLPRCLGSHGSAMPLAPRRKCGEVRLHVLPIGRVLS